MAQRRNSAINNYAIRAALRQAWENSNPGATVGHEEGGFILRDSEDNLSVVRWPQGAQGNIALPPHPGCKIGENDIVATFHTHPNTGNNYLQQPSETDKRAVRDDPDLKGVYYEGEFVVSQETIYLIAPSGRVGEIGNTQEIFDQE